MLPQKVLSRKNKSLSRTLEGLLSLGAVLGASSLVGFSLVGFSAAVSQAHEVEISNEVGGTLHIEPNDIPASGTPQFTWIALTRRGGQSIPLSECNCTLSVYAQPRQPGDRPIQQPRLSATAAEGQQGIPSTSITFPSPGAYELVLQGSPVTSGSFAPFELKFSVTVAQ